jgi:hypothetical protein
LETNIGIGDRMERVPLGRHGASGMMLAAVRVMVVFPQGGLAAPGRLLPGPESLGILVLGVAIWPLQTLHNSGVAPADIARICFLPSSPLADAQTNQGLRFLNSENVALMNSRR